MLNIHKSIRWTALILLLTTTSICAAGLTDGTWTLSQTPGLSLFSSDRTSESKSDCAVGETEVEASWQRALTAAKTAFKKHRRTLRRTDTVVIINYDTTVFDPWTQQEMPDRLRVYTVGKEWTVQQKTWVSQAHRSGLKCARTFSNVPESLISSRGAFMTHRTVHKSPTFGYPALKVHGLEKGVNHNAFRRAIIFHQASYHGSPIDYSEGCFMTRPNVNQHLPKTIAGGGLVYVHATQDHTSTAQKD